MQHTTKLVLVCGIHAINTSLVRVKGEYPTQKKHSEETCPACDSGYVTNSTHQVASVEEVDASELVPKLYRKEKELVPA